MTNGHAARVIDGGFEIIEAIDEYRSAEDELQVDHVVDDC